MANNIQRPRQKITIEDFSQVNLIHKDTGIINKIAPNHKLAVKDIVLNSQGEIKIKGEGLQFRAPFIQESYVIDLTEYSVTLRSNETGGKYSQDIGLGHDAKLSLAISFRVQDDENSITNLVRQQEGYKGAIRRTSEAIMRLLVLKHFRLSGRGTDGHSELDLTEYYDKKKIILDILGLWDNVSADPNIAEDYDLEITNEAELLYNTYGIVLSKITIVDMDLPQEIQAMIEKNKTAAAERERARAESELQKQIAKNEAEADFKRRKRKYDAYKQAGLTEEQIAEIIKMQNVPMDANVFLNSDSLTQNIVKGTKASRK